MLVAFLSSFNWCLNASVQTITLCKLVYMFLKYQEVLIIQINTYFIYFAANCHCFDEPCVQSLGEWKCPSWTCDRGWYNAPYCNQGEISLIQDLACSLVKHLLLLFPTHQQCLTAEIIIVISIQYAAKGYFIITSKIAAKLLLSQYQNLKKNSKNKSFTAKNLNILLFMVFAIY